MGRIVCVNKDNKIAPQNYMSTTKLEPRSILNLKHLSRLIKKFSAKFTQ